MMDAGKRKQLEKTTPYAGSRAGFVRGPASWSGTPSTAESAAVELAVLTWPDEYSAGDLLRVDAAAAPSGTTLRISGELDILTLPELTRVLEDQIAKATDDAPLRLDLSGVDFISAAALSTLLARLGIAQHQGVPVQVVAASQAVHRLLSITGQAVSLNAVAAPVTARHDVVVPGGALDRTTASAVCGQLRANLATAVRGARLVVDLTDVTTVDAHGLTVLFTAAQCAQARGVTIDVVECSRIVVRELDRIGLGQALRALLVEGSRRVSHRSGE